MNESIQPTQYISNEEHYEKVIERIKNVKKVLWVGTADIKDLYVRDTRGVKPLLKVLSDLVKNGVEIRLIHAKVERKRGMSWGTCHPASSEICSPRFSSE